MPFDKFSLGRETVPGKPAARGRSRANSAVSLALGHAGQALGAVGAPSGPGSTISTAASTCGPEPQPQPSPGRGGRLSGTQGSQTGVSPAAVIPGPSSNFSSPSSFGHPPHYQPHPNLLHRDGPISPPTTSTTTQHRQRPPPVTNTGTGPATGLGIGLNSSSRPSGSGPRAIPAAAAPLGHSHHQPQHSPTRPFPSSSLSPAKLSLPFQGRINHQSRLPAASSAAQDLASSRRSSDSFDHRALPAPNGHILGLRPSAGSGTATGSAPGPAAALSSPPMFDLPSIPTSEDDFSSIPYLNSNASPTSHTPAAPKTQAQGVTGQQQQQQQPQQQEQQQQEREQQQRPTPSQYSGPPGSAASHSDDASQPHHMQGSNQYQQHGQMSPRDYTASSAAPHIKLDQAPSNPSSYQGSPAVPSVLQPGGSLSRPQATGANASASLPTMQGSISQQQDYQSPAKPALNLSHSYSRSSPAAAYDGANPGFSPYTPTTPNAAGPSSSQFMSPTDRSYNAPGSQRNISHTPLGLADIRPRADSSLSDGMPSGIDFSMQNTPPGTSNYMAPWATYAFDWCKWAPQGNGAGKVAIGSYLEDGHNFIQILDTQITPTPPDIYNNHGGSKWTMDFTKIAEATHSYPVTRLLWEPPSSTKQSTDLLATSGDHLRLWSLPSETPSTPGNSITGRNREPAATKLTPLALLSNSKTPDHTAPLTSLDWNTVSPSLIITSSIDTTCTIWDIPSLTAKTQLIAHDKEVYDVRFCANSVDVFVSCGQDGSVRMFDLRSLEHSTIIYEPTGKEDRVDPNGGKMSPTLAQQTMSNPPPLLRLATSPHDTQLLATFAQDSNVIRILDTRQPGQALLELRGHGGSLNCVEWSPTRRGQLASGGDDCQVLIWDLMNQPQSNGTPQSDNVRSPAASWQCDYEVSNLGWVPRLPNDDAAEWLGVSGGRGLWGVRM